MSSRLSAVQAKPWLLHLSLALLLFAVISIPSTHADANTGTEDNTKGNSARIISVLPPEDITFNKSFLPNTIGPGSVSTLQYNIANTSTLTPASNLAFADVLPANVTIATPANVTNNCSDSTVTAADGGSNISFSGDRLGTNANCTITVDVTSSVPGSYVSTSGDLTSSFGNSGSATDTLIIDAGRAGFNKNFAPNNVGLGDVSTLTFLVDNSLNGAQVFNFFVSDPLPSGLEVASPANASTNCPNSNFAPAAGDTSLNLQSFFLPAGATCTASVDIVNTSFGQYVNVATLTAGGTASGNGTAFLNVSASSGVLDKNFSERSVLPGSTTTLQFNLINRDRGNSATNIAFSDDLDAMLSGATAVALPSVTSCGAGAQISGTSVISFTGGSLAPEATCSFDVTVQIPVGAASGTYTNTTSLVSLELSGDSLTDAAATDTLAVATLPTFIKTYLDNPVAGGGTTELEFTITNNSSSTSLSDLTFTDLFNEIIQTAASVPTGPVCGESGTVTFIPLTTNPAQLTLTDGFLEPGESCTFSLVLNVVTGAATGNYVNTTSDLTGLLGDSTIGVSGATDTLTVVAAPTLRKSFASSGLPGGTVVLGFTLSHDDTAIADATNIAFTDDLDAMLSGLVATGLPASNVCGTGSQISGTSTLTFSGGALTPGESCTFSITLQIPNNALPGSYTNTSGNVTANIAGISATGTPAQADLDITSLFVSKSFTNDPTIPGGTVTLEYTIDNTNSPFTATNIFFTDNMNNVINGISIATPLPLNDICGTGSTLSASGSFLIFQNGNLLPGESCVFSVELNIPATVEDGSYGSTSSNISADVNGSTISLDPAIDNLDIESPSLLFTKEFTDDPASSGGTVTLQFFIQNSSSTFTITNIAFTDNLNAALSGLIATSLPVNDVCGSGSQISGTNLLTFSGGTLAPGASCTFAISLQVPQVNPGTTAVNTTSNITGSAGGLTITSEPASDTLLINVYSFTKAFGNNVLSGNSTTLAFTINNLDPNNEAFDINFFDNLNSVIPGMTATNLPQSDICGEGSQLSGTSTILFTDGFLSPGTACTFTVTVQIPLSAAAGTYLNTTSDLTVSGLIASSPATDTITVDPSAGDTIFINFQTATAPEPAGYLADDGQAYGTRGNGLDYGWNSDNTDNARDRNWFNIPPDQRYDTLNHMELDGINRFWEIGVSDGWYLVHLVAGDPAFRNGSYLIDVEGTLTVNGAPTVGQYWVAGVTIVEVTDGRLTVSNNASSTGNNKLSFIEITPLGAAPGGFSSQVNFQNSGAATPAGYLADDGSLFGTLGSYGWDSDITGNARDRDSASAIDQRYDTLNQMQLNNGDHSWEIEVPNGVYVVYLANGDPQFYINHLFETDVEGTTAINGDGQPVNRLRSISSVVTVQVTDGRLTVSNGGNANKNKIQFIEITQIGG